MPQFYLREFADPEGLVHVFDKQTGKEFATSPKNIAGERYFYDSERAAEAFGDKQAVEKYLAHFEQELAPRITNLVYRLKTNGFLRLHPETRAAAAVFAALQTLRSKENRLRSRQISESILRFLKKHNGTEALKKEIEESLNEEAERSFQAAQLFDIRLILQIANILESHIWVIKKAHPSAPFWTSDQPITRKENVHDEFRSNGGLASPGIEIHIPLSPTHMIVCYERGIFGYLSHLDGQIHDLKDPQNMIYYQQFPVREAVRYIFSSTGNFDFARKLCEKQPELRNPGRRRVASNHDEE